MKETVKRVFDTLRPRFLPGGKWERLYPIYEAFETFFLFPDHVTQGPPHIRDSLDVKRFMSFVILALVPPFLFGVVNVGYYARIARGLSPTVAAVLFEGLSVVIPLVIVSYAVGFFWEFLFSVVRRHPISEGLLVTGLLYPLTLPPTMPLWQAAVGISFGVVIGKEVFGGTGRNILNPALTGRAFVFFAYPASMSGDSVWTVMKTVEPVGVDAFSGATPLSVSAVETGQSVSAALSEAGYTFGRLLMGAHPGSIGETSALCCILGAIVLILVGVASYRIMLGGVLGVLITGFVLNAFSGAGTSPWLSLNPFYHLVMGGFMFGIVYMATDPVSAPGVESARWIYGFLIGVLTILIRVFNPAYPEGVMLAILFMNIFAPLLDHLAIRARLRGRIPNV